MIMPILPNLRALRVLRVPWLVTRQLRILKLNA